MYRLYHTIGQPYNTWPFPFSDVQNIVTNGNALTDGLIMNACAANKYNGDLHVLALAAPPNGTLYHTIRKAGGRRQLALSIWKCPERCD